MDLNSIPSDVLTERVFSYPKPENTTHALALIGERRELTYELAERAYGPKQDPRAWEGLNRGLYRINWAHRFFGWDLVARFLVNVANEVEEKYIPLVSLPRPMKGKEFVDYCTELFWERTTAKHPLIDFLAAGKGTPEQLRLYMKGLWYRGRSFHTHISLFTLNLDFERTIALYKMLADEGGS